MFSYMISGVALQLKELYDSKLFDLVLATGISSYFGAWGAQKLAERERRRDELIREIRNINTGISLSLSIFNQFAGLKKQHVKRMYEDYIKQKADFEDSLKKYGDKGPPGGMMFAIDMQTLSLEWAPIEVLQSKVFGEISIVGRALNLASIIGVEFHALTDALARRNAIIEDNKSRNVTQLPLHYYFGKPDPKTGNINEDWPSLLRGIDLHVNCGIFFTYMLCKDLMEHGEHVAARLKKQYGCNSVQVNKVIFSSVDAGIIPPEDNFKDWTENFKKHEKESFLNCFKYWLTTFRVI